MSAGRGPRPHKVHRAVLELGETLRAEHDLPSLLKLTTTVVIGVIQTDVVAILELESDGTSMRGLAAAGTDSTASMRRIVDQPDPWSWEAVRSGRAVVVLDGAAQTIADGHDHQAKDSGHQEQEDQHQEGVAGALVDQAGDIVQILADDVGAAAQGRPRPARRLPASRLRREHSALALLHRSALP